MVWGGWPIEVLRERFEAVSGRRWWRRDLVLRVLEAVYPRWINAADACRYIALALRDPREAERGWGKRGDRVSQNLRRLHSWGDCDRIGRRRHGLAGSRRGTGRGGAPVLSTGESYRYRLRKDAEMLL